MNSDHLGCSNSQLCNMCCNDRLLSEKCTRVYLAIILAFKESLSGHSDR